jgi:hypothetical protein
MTLMSWKLTLVESLPFWVYEIGMVQKLVDTFYLPGPSWPLTPLYPPSPLAAGQGERGGRGLQVPRFPRPQ